MPYSNLRVVYTAPGPRATDRILIPGKPQSGVNPAGRGLGVEDLVDVARGDGVDAVDVAEIGGEVGNVGAAVDLQGDGDVLARVFAAVDVHVGDLEVA
jgi:hypothetical protein